MRQLRDFPWQRWVLAAILLLAVTLRSEGLFRSPRMHPDENQILIWMQETIERGRLKGSYPGGFFIMAENARLVCERVWFRPWQKILYHTGAIDRIETQLPPLEFGRTFIVFLGGLTVLLIYLLCRRVSGSRAAALFGATLFAFAAYPIEHSHYLETDVPMVAMLTLALWLWARYAQTLRWGGFALAAIATGYAVGTKTWLLYLVPPVFFFSLRRGEGEPAVRPWWRSGRLAVRVMAGAVLVIVGFVWSTPAAVNFVPYIRSMIWGSGVAYKETTDLLGPARTEPWTRQLFLLRELRHYLGSVGSGWLLLAAAGLPLLFGREHRRFWPVTLLFPALYLFHFIFLAPWVRSQEFMNFLPSFAVAAAVAAAWMIDRAGRRPWGAAGRVAAVLLLLALAVPTAQLGVAAASRCGWTDTRDLARSWLLRHLPYETTITAESYTSPASYEVAHSEIDVVQKVESEGLPLLLEKGAAYLIRNPSVKNRGQDDPRTGAPYPDGRARLDAFRAGAELLRVWSVIEPEQPRVTFRSPMLELWGLRPAAAGPVLDLALPQPMYVGETGRETFFPIGGTLGAADGVLIDRDGREFAVGGQQAPTEPVYIIVNTQGLPAQVHVQGFGRSRTADLQPFDVAAIPLRRPWWSPRFGSYERIRAWTRPQAGVVYLPCWLRVAFDATAAARLLAELGRPDRAWEVLEANGGGTDPGLAFRVAVETGRKAAAVGLEPAAAAQLESVEKVLRGEIVSWRLNGLSADRYDEFARLRTGERDEVATLRLLEREDRAGAAPPPFEAVQSISLRLAGPSTLRMEVRVRDQDVPRGGGELKSADGRLELRDAADRLLFSGAWGELSGTGFQPLKITLERAARERTLNLRWNSSRAGIIEVRNIEVEWKLAAALGEWARAQWLALAHWNLDRGGLPEARAARAAIPEPDPNDFDVDLRRLDLELALAQGGTDGIERAARRLLERAPGHYQAMRALAGGDPQSASAAEALAGESEAFVFGRLVAIRRAGIANGRLRLVIEALIDDSPALAVEARERKFNRWKRLERVALSPRRALHAGERVVVDLPLGSAKFTRLGVSIITDNPFVQGELPVRDAQTVWE